MLKKKPDSDPWAWSQRSPTHQNVLDFILATLDVVQNHVLEDVLPVLQLVHLVVSIGVEHRPAQELGQRLEEMRGNKSIYSDQTGVKKNNQ